jgi:hypothetical protein
MNDPFALATPLLLSSESVVSLKDFASRNKLRRCKSRPIEGPLVGIIAIQKTLASARGHTLSTWIHHFELLTSYVVFPRWLETLFTRRNHIVALKWCPLVYISLRVSFMLECS